MCLRYEPVFAELSKRKEYSQFMFAKVDVEKLKVWMNPLFPVPTPSFLPKSCVPSLANACLKPEKKQKKRLTRLVLLVCSSSSSSFTPKP